MDRATVTYLIAGTVRHKTITGPHLNIQMRRDATLVQISPTFGDPPTRIHLFRWAEHIDIERDPDD